MTSVFLKDKSIGTSSEREESFEVFFGKDINKGSSERSKNIFDNIEVDIEEGKTEVRYKGTRVIFTDNKGKVRFDGRAKGRINELKEKLKEVQINTALVLMLSSQQRRLHRKQSRLHNNMI